MQTHVAQLTKQRLSDFFVKEDGHVTHQNALVAGTVAGGTILTSLMLTPDATAQPIPCGEVLYTRDSCYSDLNDEGHWSIGVLSAVSRIRKARTYRLRKVAFVSFAL